VESAVVTLFGVICFILISCLHEIDEVLLKKVKGQIVESTVGPLLDLRINGIDLSTKFTRETGELLRKKRSKVKPRGECPTHR
jgi:hypothetical protein